MRLVFSLLSLLLLAGPVRAGALDDIERLRERGEIDQGTYHRLRVTAIRYPEQLPTILSGSSTPVTRVNGTAVLVEAFQWVVAHGSPDDPIHALLAPPAELEFSLDSSDIPVRVYYEAPDAEVADDVMRAAEESWALQVDTWGWRAPLYEPTLGPYRIYIGATGSGVAGYTSPYDSNPETPHSDCFTFIVINPGLGDFTRATVAHELNHAMQAATDCNEVISFWENTAVYIEVATYPELAMQALWSLYSFQAVPWRSLDYFEYGQGYQYGGSLWNFFLVDAFDAPETGLMFVRDVWEASMQEDNANSVTFFDGTAQVLSERTGEASPLEPAFLDFCEARLFVGSRDDGAHIDGAGDWWFGELILTDRHTVFELPLLGATPDESRRPAPYGSNHIQVDLGASYTAPLRFRFQGEEGNRWAARVLMLGSGASDAIDVAVDPVTLYGEEIVPTEGYQTLVLVVANLGPEGFRPGVGRRDGGIYTYDILPEIPAPVILGADPPTLAAGQQDVLVTILGEGFVIGQDFRVVFEDPNLQVTSLLSVTSEEIMLRLTVPALTELGPKTVVITNHGGKAATGVDVVEIVAPPTDKPKKGCACRGGRGEGGAPGFLLFLGLWAAWRNRRRRAGSTRRHSE